MTYGKKMKLAQMVLTDCNLLTILERLDIRFGFGEATVEDICRRYNFSTEFFLMICRICSFRDYKPDAKQLKRDDLFNMLHYLRASHRYYLENCFPELTEEMERLAASCNKGAASVLLRFYNGYFDEVKKHFDYEEKTVFPYIDALLAGEESDNDYNIALFEINHSDFDEKLNDLKNIIVKYLPEDCPLHEQTRLLLSIFHLEDDLKHHTLIENRLLVPLVLKIEHHE